MYTYKVSTTNPRYYEQMSITFNLRIESLQIKLHRFHLILNDVISEHSFERVVIIANTATPGTLVQ